MHSALGRRVGRVYFAGEETSREFYGYFQGVYFEGLRIGTAVAGYAGRGKRY
jgi:polyamine oxidase